MVLNDIGGSVDVGNQNGAIEVSGVVAKTSRGCNTFTLDTSFAPIRIFLPEDGGYNLTARTSFGKITSELTVSVAGMVGGDSLAGKIGSGECEVRLSNSNAGIEIRKATSMPPTPRR